jgi:hypothetical protein
MYKPSESKARPENASGLVWSWTREILWSGSGLRAFFSGLAWSNARARTTVGSKCAGEIPRAFLNVGGLLESGEWVKVSERKPIKIHRRKPSPDNLLTRGWMMRFVSLFEL